MFHIADGVMARTVGMVPTLVVTKLVITVIIIIMDDFVNWIMIDVFAMSSDSLIFIGASQALTGSDEVVVIVNHCLTETGGIGSSLVEFQSDKVNDISCFYVISCAFDQTY